MSDTDATTLTYGGAETASEEQTDDQCDRDDVPATEYERGRKRPLEAGAKIRGKIKRGTATRDQDMLLLEGRGENAAEAARDFEAALQAAEERGWPDRLRELQADQGEEDEGGEEADGDE